VIRFRTFASARARDPATGMPEEVALIVAGTLAELQIDGVFPLMTCFVQIDLDSQAVRWAHGWFMGLCTVQNVQQRPVADRGQNTAIHITFSDRGGITRTLELRMPEEKAESWAKGLETLLKLNPRSASPAHWRWALSCMTSTSKHGASGFLPRSKLRSLLLRANANAYLSKDALDGALQSGKAILHHREQIQWLHAAPTGREQKLLNVQQIMGLLLELCALSPEIQTTFDRYSANGEMRLADWLAFVSANQVAPRIDEGEAGSSATQIGIATLDSDADRTEAEELRDAQQWFESTCSNAPTSGGAVGAMQFALRLLSPQNDAMLADVADAHTLEQGLMQPLPQYWTACSHNTYIVGDQLTGLSSPDAYRRQLLQGCRHVEIDAWNSRKGPIVTHGMTFCTVVKFEEVTKAVAECAFVNSDQPVILSMEMHCSRKQQRALAQQMIEHFGSYLFMACRVHSAPIARVATPAT